MISIMNVLQSGHEERKMSGLENKIWWKIIFYCMGFFLIFFISAIVVTLLTCGIPDPSARFAIREIFLRLPLTVSTPKRRARHMRASIYLHLVL